MTAEEEALWGIEKLHVVRSEIPAVTHVDYSARIQTVRREANVRYYDLIARFGELTGVPVLLNTSFNVRGEPIVETPEDAVNCFLRTGLDYLAMHDMLLSKTKMHKPLEGAKRTLGDITTMVRRGHADY